MDSNQLPHLEKSEMFNLYPQPYKPSKNGLYPREFYSNIYNTNNISRQRELEISASALNFILLGGFRGLRCGCNDSDEEDIVDYNYKEMKESKLHKDLIE